MLKRFLWAALIGLITVTVAGASAVAGPDKSQARAQVLRVAIGAEPPSLDAGLATDTISANLLFNLMDPLIRLGDPPELKALPGAATSWSVKGSTLTLNLRRNARWTTGKPVTAGDYVWSWLRTISPELGADYAYQFYGIKGAEAFNGCKSNCAAARAKVGLQGIRPVQAADSARLAAVVVHPAAVAHLVPARPQGHRPAAWQELDGAGEHRHQRPVQAGLVAA